MSRLPGSAALARGLPLQALWWWTVLASASPVAEVNSPVQVIVNGKVAQVIGAVGYPGAVDGYQVNFRVPPSIGAPHAPALVLARGEREIPSRFDAGNPVGPLEIHRPGNLRRPTRRPGRALWCGYPERRRRG